MSHAYARNHLHVIFGTKGRRASIQPAVQENLWAYIRGIARNYKIDLEAIGGTENHVHLLLVLPPKLSLADAIRAIKANSSKWMNENGHLFAWQEGYAAFTQMPPLRGWGVPQPSREVGRAGAEPALTCVLDGEEKQAKRTVLASA